MIEIPESGPNFEAILAEIDEDLAKRGVPIASRPLEAVGEYSKRFGNIPIPLGDGSPNAPEWLKRYQPLADNIRRWFADRYGKRLNVDFCVGRAITLVESDAYTLRIPTIFSSVEFVTQRQFIEKKLGRGPAVVNVVQLIDEMTEGRALTLSDASLERIWDDFSRALRTLYVLRTPQPGAGELVQIAGGDVATAVAAFMAPGERYGESKWASLQAAEKLLKAAIRLSSGSFSKTHILSKLIKELQVAGINQNLGQIVASIQCTPSIRYGDEPCSRMEALQAHHATLDLLNALMAAGIPFESSLDLR